MKEYERLTIRQQMISHLETMPLTSRDISKLVRISEKDVHLHLAAIEKTVRRQNKKLRTTPYFCHQCGFEFKKRTTFKAPGKCPKCRHSRIGRALFEIIDTAS